MVNDDLFKAGWKIGRTSFASYKSFKRIVGKRKSGSWGLLESANRREKIIQNRKNKGKVLIREFFCVRARVPFYRVLF